ncbi:MAG: hypothetical protein H7343_08590 [Undibacterium sp.]|nr:hypothetical protein [Opitutaceae bacterium]
MKIIFDENVPRPLRQFLTAHTVTTVQQHGRMGVENGALMDLTAGNFDIPIPADKNLRYQQDLRSRRIALIDLPTNRWPMLKALGSQIPVAVGAATPGSYTVIEFP